ncbi:hypothetical protein [Bartonella sp. CB60]|uniref:hypothetical protein n=1 Tax=Bartonella sp. CB60 TaxID=3113619 RepID=UPI00300DFE77
MMHNIKSGFIAAMERAGVSIDVSSNKGGHPIADGKIYRADSFGHKARNKKYVWYFLHIGDWGAYGEFGDHKLGIKDTWKYREKHTKLTDKERSELQKATDAARKAHAQHVALLHRNAANVAKILLSDKYSCDANHIHPYLFAKKLIPTKGIRQIVKETSYIIDLDEEKRRTHLGTHRLWVIL